jgi:hypothetical protein
MIEQNYFMITENTSNGGSVGYTGRNNIGFTESIF